MMHLNLLTAKQCHLKTEITLEPEAAGAELKVLPVQNPKKSGAKAEKALRGQ